MPMVHSITNAASRSGRPNVRCEEVIQSISFRISRTAAAPKHHIETSVAGGETRAPISPNAMSTATGGPTNGQLTAWRTVLHLRAMVLRRGGFQ